MVRERSSSRSVLQTCQPMRLRTGKVPSRSPMLSRRTVSTTRTASTTPATTVAGTSAPRARHATSGPLEPRIAIATTMPPLTSAMTGQQRQAHG